MSVRLKLQRLGDLDKKTADAAASLDADTEALVSSLDSADAGTQRSMADRRRALLAPYDDVLKAADEKIAIAQSVYDLVRGERVWEWEGKERERKEEEKKGKKGIDRECADDHCQVGSKRAGISCLSTILMTILTFFHTNLHHFSSFF